MAGNKTNKRKAAAEDGKRKPATPQQAKGKSSAKNEGNIREKQLEILLKKIPAKQQQQRGGQGHGQQKVKKSKVDERILLESESEEEDEEEEGEEEEDGVIEELVEDDETELLMDEDELLEDDDEEEEEEEEEQQQQKILSKAGGDISSSHNANEFFERQFNSKNPLLLGKSSNEPNKAPTIFVLEHPLLKRIQATFTPSIETDDDSSSSSSSFEKEKVLIHAKLQEGWNILSKAASLKKKGTAPSSSNLGKKLGGRRPSIEESNADFMVKAKEAILAATLTNSTNPLNDQNMTPLQASLYHPFLSQYRDVFFFNQCTSGTMNQELSKILALHCLQHIIRGREIVGKNSIILRKIEQEQEQVAKIAAAEAKSAKNSKGANSSSSKQQSRSSIIPKRNVKEEEDNDDKYRDQSFTRPKVLVILPMKNDAYMFIRHLITISQSTHIENETRFTDEFSDPNESDGPTPADLRKPDDYRETFKGNIDDCFKIGIKFSLKKEMKLFSSFYGSDVIIASPLGLSMIIGNSGDKKRDFDYLSSIEMVIMDKADRMLMQNWEHVRQIFDHLNLTPTSSHGCDFSRTKTYVLDGKAPLVRQNIILSHQQLPEINALISKYSQNISGRVKITQEYKEGSICEVVVKIPQVFHRIPTGFGAGLSSATTNPNGSNTTISSMADARFKFFIAEILPTLRNSSMSSSSHNNLLEQSHTLIVVPSYFDFVRIRNYMTDHNYSVAPLSEYTSRSKVDRARNEFMVGDVKFMLYSERYHYFRRTRIKGVKHVVFYQPPTFSRFYSEIVNLIGMPLPATGAGGAALKSNSFEMEGEGTCSVLFSALDGYSLERIVGSQRMEKMIKGSKQAYMFSL